jgi:hypothetical protein
MPIKTIFTIPIQLKEVLKACIKPNITDEMVIARYLFDSLYKFAKMNPLDKASSVIAIRKNTTA